MVRFRLLLDGSPLRRTYVSHFDFFRLPQQMFFVSDENGFVTISNEDSWPPNRNGPTGRVEVCVHAENPVVRVLDGKMILPLDVTQKFQVSDNGTVNINTAREQVEYFRIADMCRDVYDTVFRVFSPYNNANRRAFPFGRRKRRGDARAKRKIDVVYPSTLAVNLTFVEPFGTISGNPTIHLTPQSKDTRLFGDATNAPSLLPHEMGHALHFALMPSNKRIEAESKYLGWLFGDLIGGGAGTSLSK